MRQFILPSSYDGEGTLVLTGKESRYLSRVLRLKVGSQIAARDREGKSYSMTITAISREHCSLTPSKGETSLATLPAYSGPMCNLVLMQCLLKGHKEDTLVRQATEIGVSSIALVQSRHCVSDAKERSASRIERLNAKIREALQQSGSSISTHLERQIVPLLQLPAWWGGRGTALFFHQSTIALQQDLPSVVSTLSCDGPVGVLIGPEGGFSDEECAFLSHNGFIPVMLKTNILRSETAAIYALSALQVLMNNTIKPLHLS
ncbi:MAG: RsmE family RNA methyltransferase [Sphaerochaeta sp.]|jgi:16S rRNA (uracil1498-N3)-methyltransferase|nr:16S rRNA (uracil(1498)-N(3))-methyltransferase [Sphaerochaeta sp.]MDX9914822.1 RsmE family RNA methyltransferase [Sphaerochaeta sp.]